MNTVTKRLLLLLLAVLFIVHAKAQGINDLGVVREQTDGTGYSPHFDLKGTWILNKIDVSITTDGQNTQKTYTNKEEFKTPTPCIARLEFASDSLSILFKGRNNAESAPYSISGEILIWNYLTARFKFHIEYNNGILILSREGKCSIGGVISQYKYVHYLTKKQ